MYILSVWVVLVALIHSGLSVNSEDTDLNSLSSSYDFVGENAENFEVGLVQIDKLSILSIEEICKDSEKVIYVRQEDITISCKELFNEEINKDLNRVRREADVEEGSGLEEVTTTETTPEETTSEATTQEKTTTEETTSEVTTQEETTTEETISETTTPEPVNVPEEVPTLEKIEDEQQKNETVEIGPVAVQGAKVIEIISEKSDETQQQESKEPRLVEEPPEVPKIENSDKDPKKDVEKVKGRKLIDSPEKEETKEQNHGERVDSVQESTSPKKAGSKDTTILIVLFVAVVVVGVLAFGYNFIKKKRQQNRDLENVERNSSIKRSLQNLTKPEGGEAEKKPLIGESKEVEMVDMKKQEEPKENGESLVKS